MRLCAEGRKVAARGTCTTRLRRAARGAPADHLRVVVLNALGYAGRLGLGTSIGEEGRCPVAKKIFRKRGVSRQPPGLSEDRSLSVCAHRVRTYFRFAAVLASATSLRRPVLTS
jgi:hypothetical protein